MEKRLSAYCRLEMVRIAHAAFGVEILDAKCLFSLFHPRLGDLNRFLLLVNGVVLFVLQPVRNLRKGLVEVLCVACWP